MRKDAKVEEIAQIPLFAHCTKKELRLIAALADGIELPDGTLLAREGQFGQEFFIILDGTVQITRKGRNVKTLTRGDFFGEIALLTNSPRTATAKASGPIRALVVASRDFRRLLETTPQIQIKVLTALAERLAPSAL
jgi:CRP-like cAMP-binding protein